MKSFKSFIKEVRGKQSSYIMTIDKSAQKILKDAGFDINNIKSTLDKNTGTYDAAELTQSIKNTSKFYKAAEKYKWKQVSSKSEYNYSTFTYESKEGIRINIHETSKGDSTFTVYIPSTLVTKDIQESGIGIKFVGKTGDFKGEKFTIIDSKKSNKGPTKGKIIYKIKSLDDSSYTDWLTFDELKGELDKDAIKQLSESGINWLFDSPEEAMAAAQNIGTNGYHEVDGKYMPGKNHEEFMFYLQTYKKKSHAGLDLT